MMIRLLFVATFVAFATTHAATPAAVSGTVTKVDRDAKVFTVKAKNAEAAVQYGSTTSFETVKPAKANVLTDGCKVKVNGKFSQDQTVITANSIERLPDDWKSSAINAKDSFCFGVFHKKDDTLAITVGAKTIAIKPTDKMHYFVRVKSQDGDLEAGKAVWINVASIDQSGKRLAQTIVIRPPTTGKTAPARSAKPTGPAAATPPPATVSAEQAKGTIAGTVTQISFQDLILKVAKDGNPQQVITYDITMFTTIVVNNKPAQIVDVKTGMKVTVVSSDGKVAERISATGSLPAIKRTPKKPAKPKK